MDLHRAYLRGTYLTETNLHTANLTEAKVTVAQLEAADNADAKWIEQFTAKENEEDKNDPD